MPASTDRSRLSLVWDVPTRLFHLGLIFAVAGCWWTYRVDRMGWHRLFGYAAAGLLVFRIYWGLLGASTARFRGLLAGPREIRLYVRGEGRPFAGHNPLGGWSVAALLSLLVIQVGSGLFALDLDDLAPGPMSDWVSPALSQAANRLHSAAFDALLGLIALHIAAVFLHLLGGDNLIGAMVHGRKRLRNGTPEIAFAPRWRAIPGVAFAFLVIAFLWRMGSS